MPTTRRRIAIPRAPHISGTALHAWTTGDGATLYRELGIGPHQYGPFDVDRAEPPAWEQRDGPQVDLHGGPIKAASWRHAWALRKQLIELAGPPGRGGRHGEPLGPKP